MIYIIQRPNFLINLCDKVVFGLVEDIGLLSPIIWSSVFINRFSTASSDGRKFSIMVNILLICWSSGGV